MDETMLLIVNILQYVLIIFISFLFFRMITKASFSLSKSSESMSENFDNYMKNRKSYSKTKKRLLALGISYRIDTEINPGRYYLYKIFCGCILAVFGVLITKNFRVLPSIFFFLAGFFFLDIYFRLKNKSDNSAMLNDLLRIYLSLKMQLSSNIYILEALQSCLDKISNERLKIALTELVVDMSNKKNTYQNAVNYFEMKFTSPDIKKFCGFLRSYIRYGSSEKYLNDMMAEINDITKATALKTKHDLDMKAGLLSIGLFACIITIILVSAVQSFFSMNIF